MRICKSPRFLVPRSVSDRRYLSSSAAQLVLAPDFLISDILFASPPWECRYVEYPRSVSTPRSESKSRSCICPAGTIFPSPCPWSEFAAFRNSSGVSHIRPSSPSVYPSVSRRFVAISSACPTEPSLRRSMNNRKCIQNGRLDCLLCSDQSLKTILENFDYSFFRCFRNW